MDNHMHRIFTTTLSLVALSLTGCATTPTKGDKPTFPLAATAGFDDGLDATAMTIHKGDLSGTIAFADMIDDLSDADVILVGEMHNHSDSLDFIATTFEALIERNPNLILSMEFYERDEQVALDDYLAGITDYPAFLKNSGRNKGNNPIGHLRMIELCKENNRAVIAANSPRRYSKVARKDGFDGLQELNARQRALIEIPTDLPTGSYAARFRDAMSGMAAHGGENMITGFLRSQTLWDQTMAASIAQGVEANASVFHVVGHFHVDHNLTPGGSAMADAVRARLGSHIKVRSIVVHGGDAGSITSQDAGADDEMHPGSAADYILYFND